MFSSIDKRNGFLARKYFVFGNSDDKFTYYKFVKRLDGLSEIFCDVTTVEYFMINRFCGYDKNNIDSFDE